VTLATGTDHAIAIVYVKLKPRLAGAIAVRREHLFGCGFGRTVPAPTPSAAPVCQIAVSAPIPVSHAGVALCGASGVQR